MPWLHYQCSWRRWTLAANFKPPSYRTHGAQGMDFSNTQIAAALVVLVVVVIWFSKRSTSSDDDDDQPQVATSNNFVSAPTNRDDSRRPRRAGEGPGKHRAVSEQVSGSLPGAVFDNSEEGQGAADAEMWSGYILGESGAHQRVAIGNPQDDTQLLQASSGYLETPPGTEMLPSAPDEVVSSEPGEDTFHMVRSRQHPTRRRPPVSRVNQSDMGIVAGGF